MEMYECIVVVFFNLDQSALSLRHSKSVSLLMHYLCLKHG